MRFRSISMRWRNNSKIDQVNEAESSKSQAPIPREIPKPKHQKETGFKTLWSLGVGVSLESRFAGLVVGASLKTVYLDALEEEL